jgi:hypothetical protein
MTPLSLVEISVPNVTKDNPRTPGASPISTTGDRLIKGLFAMAKYPGLMSASPWHQKKILLLASDLFCRGLAGRHEIRSWEVLSILADHTKNNLPTDDLRWAHLPYLAMQGRIRT